MKPIACSALLAALSAAPASADVNDWLVAVAIGSQPTFTATSVAIPSTADIGTISDATGATYEFCVNANNDGASSALLGAINTGAGRSGALKFEQWADSEEFGVTAWGVADYYIASNIVDTDLHIVFVSDFAADTCDLYVNGSLLGTAPWAPWFTGQVGLGQIWGPSSTWDVLTGTMYGVATYEGKLDAAEIAEHSTAFLDGGQPIGTNYCISVPNSTGSAAVIEALGSGSVADNFLVLQASPVPNQLGIFFYGSVQSLVPFGNGFRCTGVSGPVGLQRLGVTIPSGNVMQYQVDLTAPPTGIGTITAGSTWHFQAWFQDSAGGGSNFNLSDGIEIQFQ